MEKESSALKQLKKLYNSQDIEIIILTGSAGTGKTTLVAEFVTWLKEEKEEVCLLATTGRAAKILSDKTGLDAGTIHSAIYHFQKLGGIDNWDDASQVNMEKAGQLFLQFDLKFTSSIDGKDPDVYIIDESSMLTHEKGDRSHTARFGSGSLLDDFIQHSVGKKLVFVGDACQLPPVSPNSNSPALDPYFLSERYGKRVGMIELTRVWRQADGNEILNFATRLRDLITEQRIGQSVKITEPEGRHIHVVGGIQQLISRYAERMASGDRDYSKVTFVVHSNKLSGELNNRIRDEIGFKGTLQPGELLSVVQNSYTTALMNGDLVVVESVDADVRRAGFSFSKVTVKALHTGRRYRTLMIDDLLYNSEPSLGKEDAGRLLMDYILRMKNTGVKPGSRVFTDGLRTDPFLNALRCKFGYALTCHKTQGGEWDEVFLALNGSLEYLPGESAARWYYTAFTRARNNVWLNRGAWIGSNSPKIRIVNPNTFRF